MDLQDVGVIQPRLPYFSFQLYALRIPHRNTDKLTTFSIEIIHFPRFYRINFSYHIYIVVIYEGMKQIYHMKCLYQAIPNNDTCKIMFQQYVHLVDDIDTGMYMLQVPEYAA